MASTSRMLARNWLPRPSPFEAPRTRPAMSTKLDRAPGRSALGLAIAGERVQPRVGHRDLADVGLDGAEGIVRRLRRGGARQRVEQGGLADVRQADDSAFQAHENAREFFVAWQANPASRVRRYAVALISRAKQAFQSAGERALASPRRVGAASDAGAGFGRHCRRLLGRCIPVSAFASFVFAGARAS